MSVDRTIEELTGTLSQLGVLVEHINTQIIGISSRVNLTLNNFDHAIAEIANDAGLMTGQVGETVSQVSFIKVCQKMKTLFLGAKFLGFLCVIYFTYCSFNFVINFNNY